MAFKFFWGSSRVFLAKQPASLPWLSHAARTYANTATSEPRTAVITGSARGIGKAVALRLARDGYDVCVNDIPANRSGIEETVSEIKALGRKAIGVEADVTDYSQVQHMVQKTVKELGPLKTMIANAGIVQVKSILELTEKDFDTMFKVNLFGVQYCYKAAALQFIEQGNATQESPCKLIGASSIAALRPFELLGHYCAAKAAVVALTHSYARELGEKNITCNSYAPGIVGTHMWDLIDQEMGRLKGIKTGTAVQKGAIFQSNKDMIALGRLSVPDDVAKTVSFLAGPDSDYVTGQTMVCDGGIAWH